MSDAQTSNPDADSPVLRLRAKWQALAARERRMLQAVGGMLAFALLWWVLLAPAWHTWRKAPVEMAAVAQQLAAMRNMQAQAQALQKQPRIQTAESQSQLTAITIQMLGENSIAIQGAQATITLREVQPQQLAEWLVQARALAHAVFVQANINYSDKGWNGSMVMQLPS